MLILPSTKLLIRKGITLQYINMAIFFSNFQVEHMSIVGRSAVRGLQTLVRSKRF